jgi:hypothetical protein
MRGRGLRGLSFGFSPYGLALGCRGPQSNEEASRQGKRGLLRQPRLRRNRR